MRGRPPKMSLDYSGWETNIFDDPKIDKLMDAQGCIGFTVYFYLCQKAYGTNGYFFPWTGDDAATTARKIGGGVGSESVMNTVNFCLRIGLFNNDLYVGYKIITSRGIQKRFALVAKTRTNTPIISEYWLLEKNEYDEGLVKVALNPGEKLFSPSEIPFSPPDKSIPFNNKSTVQYNTVNNSTVQESTGDNRESGAVAFAPASPEDSAQKPLAKKFGEYGWVKLTDAEYNRLINDHSEPVVSKYIQVVDELAQQTGNKNKWRDWNLTVRKAIRDSWGGGYANKQNNQHKAPDKQIRPRNVYEELAEQERQKELAGKEMIFVDSL